MAIRREELQTQATSTIIQIHHKVGVIRSFGGHWADMEAVDGEFAAFVNELRRVLQHLYNPAELRKSPLLDVLPIGMYGGSLLALRRLLTSAIRALKPDSSVPPQSNAWRVYNLLTWRYVEQSGQREVAADMALSVRQLRRQEREAVEVLAHYLWDRYHLYQVHDLALKLRRASHPPEMLNSAPERERELEWLKKSLPSQVTDVNKAISLAVKTVAPLMERAGVQVECELPPDLPPMLGPAIAVRQALLNLLTAAARAATEGKVRVSATAGQRKVHVRVVATGNGAATEASEKVRMARQLVGLFGGTLEWPDDEASGHAFAAVLSLPAVEQMAVLVIDDNADTLQLFSRYLEGSRYRFIGEQSPERALELAQELVPRAIVLDVMLPDVDGWELLGRLREHPVLGQVPVLVCTILPQEQLALTLGAAAFVRKPVSRDTLLKALDRCVGLPDM